MPVWWAFLPIWKHILLAHFQLKCLQVHRLFYDLRVVGNVECAPIHWHVESGGLWVRPQVFQELEDLRDLLLRHCFLILGCLVFVAFDLFIHRLTHWLVCQNSIFIEVLHWLEVFFRFAHLYNLVFHD